MAKILIQTNEPSEERNAVVTRALAGLVEKFRGGKDVTVMARSDAPPGSYSLSIHIVEEQAPPKPAFATPPAATILKGPGAKKK